MTEKCPACAVGVDIGGTNIVAAIVSSSGKVIIRASIPTEPKRGPEDGFRRLGDLIERVCRDGDVDKRALAGIGVGCTGPIDSVRGRVQNPYTLPTWDDAPLIDYLTDRFALPGILLNDAHVATLGEYWVGAGQHVRHMIYITVGTGIGGGLMINGHLHRGVGLLSGEVGHQVIDLNGPQCYCGARGCLEMLAAAPAITRAAVAQAAPDGLIMKLAHGNREQINPRVVYDAAKQGDTTALEILRQTGFYLGVGVGNLLNIIAPEAVILGGGVMQGWDLIAPTIIEVINSRKAMIPYDQVKILPAKLGLNAGVIGAARGIFDHLAGQL